MLEALQTEQSCESQLRDFSGNPAYVLPRPYREIIADMRGSGPRATPAAGQKATGGCYVATAVYGSYDAPEVIVLRQFRDEHLQRTALGRRFIATYYAMSPALARRLPKHPKLSSHIGRMLDSVIERLKSKPTVSDFTRH